MNKFSCIFLTIFLLFYTGCIVYVDRANFFTPYDMSYWQERFEQSQWRLRFTDRTIGDDGLYAYQGYTYTKGADPTASNAEAPPLGKYIIGWSIQLSKNPYWAGLIVTTLSIIIFFMLLGKFISSLTFCLIGTIIFALDPLVLQQTTITMLDSSQLLFILLFSLFLISSLRAKTKTLSLLLIFLAGLSLGAFSAVKFPFLTLFFTIATIFYVWKSKLSLIPHTLLFISGIVISYIGSYIRYFQLGHSLIEWLRVQKWIVAFYRESGLMPNYGSVLTTLLINRAQNFFTRTWEQGDIWSYAWPCITILFFLLTMRVIKKQKHKSLNLFILISLAGIMLAFYSVVPFWTRYLLIILPFLYISAFYILKEWKHTILPIFFLLIFCVANIIPSFFLLFPTPEGQLKQFLYDWEHGYFNDMYERLDSSSKNIHRNTFHQQGQIYWTDGEIEGATIAAKTNQLDRFKIYQQIPITVTYKTRFLGNFTEEKILTAIRQNGQWKFKWIFSDLISGLKPDMHLATTIEPAQRGSIFENKELRAQDFPSYLVSITPGQINTKKEQEMLTYIQNLFKGIIMAAAIHDRYIVGRIPDFPVPIGILPSTMSPEEKQKLLSYPGVTITPANGRWMMNTKAVGKIKNTMYTECCSYLYSTNSYDGISGWEQEYNDTLKGYSGGKLLLIDQEGNTIKTIVEKKKVDGKEIIVTTDSP